MFSKIGFLVCLALTACSVVQAAPSPVANGLDTNASRLQSGMNPLAPVRRRPSRVSTAKRGIPSGSTTQDFSCEVCATNASVGCLKRELDSHELFTFTNGAGNHLTVHFTAATTGISTQIDITADYNNRPNAAPFMGGTGGDIGPNSGAAVGIAGVSQTAPGAPPTSGTTTVGPNSQGSTGPVESAVWTYDASNHGLTMVWINSNSNPQPCHLVYDENLPDGGLLCTGNVALYSATAGNKKVTEVNLVCN